MSVDEVIPFVKIESNLEDNPLEEILFLNQTTTAIKEEPNDNTSCADYDELEIDFHEEDPLKLDSSVRSAEELIENERSAHTQPADNLTSLSTVAQKGGDCPCPEQTSTQEQTTNFRCYDCNYTTNNRNLSMEHLLQHENYAYFTCHMCNFATNDCTYLEAHVLLHAPRVVNSAVNYLVCDFPMLNRAEEIKTKKCPSQMVCDNPKSNKDTNLKKHTPTRRKEESKCKRGGTRTGCRNTKVKKSREKSIDIKKHISGYLEKKYKHNKCDLPTIYKDTKANNNDEDDLQMIIKSRFKEHVLTYTRRKPQIKSQEENTTKEIIKPHEQGIKLTNKVIENEICDHHAGDLPKSMSTFENKGNNCCRPEGTTTEGSAYSTPKVSVVHENEICSLQETSAQEQKTDFKCSLCNYTTTNMNLSMEHLLTHKNYAYFTCHICNYATNDCTYLQKHLLIHAPPKVFNCFLCDYRATNKDDVRQHILIHRPAMEKIKCQHHQCDYETNDKRHLKIHASTHKPLVKEFKCEQCNYQTFVKGNFQMHMSTHEPKLIQCYECDFTTNSKMHLRRHLSTHKLLVEEFKCEQCNYQTTAKGRFRTHKLIHGPKNIKCDECGFATNTKSYLKRHLLTHKLLKDFKCIQCNFATMSKWHFTQHLVTHSATKNFKCSQCNYTTTLRKHLIQHLITHKRIKDLKCDQCSYVTHNKLCLREHVRKHRSKDFLCDRCSYITYSKSYLKRHLLKHKRSKK